MQVDEGTAVFKAAERADATPRAGAGGGGCGGGFIALDADGLRLPGDWCVAMRPPRPAPPRPRPLDW